MPAIDLSFEAGLKKIAYLCRYTRDPPLVLIAGGSCSGKSYFAQKLKEKLEKRGLSVSLAPLDLYFRDIDDSLMPRNEEGRRLFDTPRAYEEEKFVKDVGKLLADVNVNLPNYNMETNKIILSPGKLVLAGQLVIAEGLFAITFLATAYPGSLKVYIKAEEPVRLKRRVARDTAIYRVSRETAVINFNKKVLPCHASFVEPQRDNADYVINSS